MSVDRSAELEALVGSPAGPPAIAPEVVNRTMIRHWTEAMGDTNPVYGSEQAATEAGFEAHLVKPVEISVLDQTLVAALLRRTVAVG